MESELEFAKKLAYDAGEIMRKYFNQVDISRYKADNTIVTLADEEINQMVIDRVSENYPDHGVYGEEDSSGRDKNILWVCDPLDGTAMYARGIPVAVFSIALVVDGEPQLGVVYDPWTDRMYSATKAGGAYLNDKQIRVNKYSLADRGAVIGYDYVSGMPFNTLKAAYNLHKNTYLMSIGSMVHGVILVASGVSVAYIASGSRPHDIAAAKIIVEEAGGRVTSIYGEDQRYDRDIKGAVISNGVVHDEIIRAIKKELK